MYCVGIVVTEIFNVLKNCLILFDLSDAILYLQSIYLKIIYKKFLLTYALLSVSMI